MSASEVSDAPTPAGEPIELGGGLLRPGELIGAYRYERLLGKGGMALVLLTRDPDNQPVALKVLQGGKASTGLHRFRREFRALARLNHPNVIRVEAYGETQGHPFIAMEYADGPDLYQSLRRYKEMPPEQRWRRVETVLIELCQGLHYIHRRGLVHRDCSPSGVAASMNNTEERASEPRWCYRLAPPNSQAAPAESPPSSSPGAPIRMSGEPSASVSPKPATAHPAISPAVGPLKIGVLSSRLCDPLMGP